MKHNLKIITNETYINESKYDDPKNKLKIKIPNICKQFNVKYGMIWQFLYEMKDIVNLVQKSR